MSRNFSSAESTWSVPWLLFFLCCHDNFFITGWGRKTQRERYGELYWGDRETNGKNLVWTIKKPFHASYRDRPGFVCRLASISPLISLSSYYLSPAASMYSRGWARGSFCIGRSKPPVCVWKVFVILRQFPSFHLLWVSTVIKRHAGSVLCVCVCGRDGGRYTLDLHLMPGITLSCSLWPRVYCSRKR